MNVFNTTPNWWVRAQAQGLLQGNPVDDDEPGVLLIAMALLGAMMCMLAAAGFLMMLLDHRFWENAPVVYTVCVLGLAGAGLLLQRSRTVFVVCMALVMWGLFSGGLVLRLADDIGGNIGGREHISILLGAALTALLQLLGAALTHARWVKRIMGVVFGVAMVVLLARSLGASLLWTMLNTASVLMATAWLLWLHREPVLLQRSTNLHALAGWGAFIDSAAVGVLLCQLWQGAGGWGAEGWAWLLYGNDRFFDLDDTQLLRYGLLGCAWAVLLVVLATGWLWSRWQRRAAVPAPTLWLVGWVGALLAAGAWFNAGLGVLALIAVGALVGARWRIAVLCGLAMLWELSAFYYSLAWPLAHKGLALALMGALLLLGLWVQRRWSAHTHADANVPAEPLGASSGWPRARLLWLVAGAVLVFGAVNHDVYRKEQVIAHGQPVLVRLVPVDPRSLMQGDYMALNFDLPDSVNKALAEQVLPYARVAARLDAQGRAEVLRLLPGDTSAAAGEIVLPLKQLKGRWVLVTDAYFFPEGTGERFEQAKFGDFRVLPDGRALLVGLADAQGKAIAVP